MRKYQKIYQLIINEIHSGKRVSGDKVPSIRAMARNQGVSKNTVITAYNLLLDERWIKAAAKSGFYINEKQYDEKFQNITSEFKSAYDGVDLLKQQLIHNCSHKPGDGRYPRQYMNKLNLGSYLANPSEEDIFSYLDYGDPAGHIALRVSISKILRERSLKIDENNLLMTYGTNHSLDLIIRHFLTKGDNVLVESPGYYPLFSKLELSSVNVIPIKRSKLGIDVNILESLIRKERPKILFLQTFAHNPTGTDLSKDNIESIKLICVKYNILIVEDDPFLLSRDKVASAFFDDNHPTIYLSSFSKTVTASFRCGFIVSSKPIIESLAKLKLITVVNTSSITEAILNNLITNGSMDNHIQTLKKISYKKSKIVAEELKGIEGLTLYPHNPGGLYLWFSIPISDKKIANIAKKQNIFIAPGNLFFPSTAPYSALRINKFYMDDVVIKFIQQEIFKAE